MPIPRRRPGGDDLQPEPIVGFVRQLGAALTELGLSEVEVSWGDVRVRLQRPSASPAPAPAAALASAPVVADAAPVEGATAGLITIEAPMVGTFYRASGPTADPYVREGDVVKQGQILCIIEAMKLMNEIEAKIAGRVAKVLVENAQAVEYGQPLFLIDPVR
ncbi:MAG TPA: acetyl-CoA carboxylase biotin carboxyl carrier protein [Methylomirabilota bacterium]|jgi:acetyl-CoA carboxylase biotin carboxyl carrier protein